VIGGGASGMFAASIAAKTVQEEGLECEVVVLEGGRKLMTKVEISGGGRCNGTSLYKYKICKY